MATNRTKKSKVSSRPAANVNFGKRNMLIPAWSVYAILIMTAVVYSRSLFNGFADLDDNNYILYNPYLKNFDFNAIINIFSSFYFGNYHPFTTLTYLFEYHLYGLNPFPYHLLNAFLHIVNVFLVYKLTRNLSGQILTAVFVSALFALHPMHVESVAWISERKDVLYTAFYLSSLLAYLNYLKYNFQWKYLGLCFLFFISSLMSKSAAVTLPVLLLAIDFYKNRKPDIKFFLEKIPFFLFSVLFGIFALWSQEGAFNELEYPFFQRIFIFFYSISFYIVKLILPFNLSAVHYYPNTYGGALPWYYYASAPFILVILLLIIRKTKLRRDKIFGFAFFLIVISVMLQIIAVGSAVASERYSYVAHIGLLFIIGQWLARIQRGRIQKVALVISGLFIALFSYLTWERIAVWKDGIVLFSDVIKKYPDISDAYRFRGIYKMHAKNYRGALQDYNKTLSLKPDDALGLSGRGYVYNELQKYDEALKDLNTSLEIDSTIPESYYYRGMSHFGLMDTVLAMKDYNKAIQLDPLLQEAYKNRSILKATVGNLKGALADADMAISLFSEDGEAFSNRANIKAMMNNFSGSFDDYSIALKFNPNDEKVLFNRGLTRLNMGDTSGACDDWNKALNLGYHAAGNAIDKFCNYK